MAFTLEVPQLRTACHPATVRCSRLMTAQRMAFIIWTRGPLACAPIPINEKLIKLIASIKTSALDGKGDEL
jgi:hypothetical protein